MGDVNQRNYVQRFLPEAYGPVLEIGSKDYGSTQNFRQFYAGQSYTGVDMADGPNVDVVADLVEGTCGLPLGHFDIGICLSVLEHVRRPWVMAENVARLMRPGGRLCISVPWSWPYHAYPDDYFRFSWRGIAELFPDFEWSHHHFSTTVEGEFIAIDPESRAKNTTLGFARRIWGRGKRSYLPYLMVNMVGTKRP